ncbi:RNA binding protein, putative [Trypanosoma brucei gambiense DAL972]|uniref:RNA binding protein, putative n=1 Tax=Trypanosoma brucei gambiense (strain MHOM/CI/86/DAL972) TaxID=679716 RepID=D0A0F7_TRYB9|nr:RNA binding protein, putative [Trypanosoma brucei gambiense DAL972]CBH16715.1 RNA binding protein, putative [Trypanosoma brucei gambiense DAL972]|eukprot:XP_011778979.1 RNA binding protein, putative [Trypanosoma brucei gambiense DAL972]
MYGNQSSGGPETPPLVWNVAKVLQDGFNNHRSSLPQLLGIAHNLEETLENTRLMYNKAVKERDELRNKLIAAQNSIVAVKRVVEQYATVNEPVVASDGFTYESELIRDYLRECASSQTKAYSQLTKEELLDVLVPNQTLSRLVKMLQQVCPMDVPPVSVRTPIPPFKPLQQGEVGSKGVGSNLNWAGDERGPGTSAIQASDVETAMVSAATTPGVSGVHSSNAQAVTSNPNGATARRWENRQAQQPQVSGFTGKNSNRKHPCLRVYGRCNFLEDCAFANYPYGACLNYIKGKCRFGQHCKELHVSSAYPRYGDQRGGGGINSGNNTANNSTANADIATPTATGRGGSGANPTTTPRSEEKGQSTSTKAKKGARESSKCSSVKTDACAGGDVEAEAVKELKAAPPDTSPQEAAGGERTEREVVEAPEPSEGST